VVCAFVPVAPTASVVNGPVIEPAPDGKLRLLKFTRGTSSLQVGLSITWLQY